MTTLKENGKYYQECEVIMLPTDKTENTILKTFNGLDTLSYFRNQYFSKDYLNSTGREGNHLYIVSNEIIKEDEINNNYCIFKVVITCLAGNTIGKVKTIGNYYKIIATTDTSLNLPQPSQNFINAFIKSYNNGNPITKILVEYEISMRTDVVWNRDYNKYKNIPNTIKTIKVNSSNEISIKKVYVNERIDKLENK